MTWIGFPPVTTLPVFLEKNGELKTVGSENIEDVKKETELNKNLNILACSWKND